MVVHGPIYMNISHCCMCTKPQENLLMKIFFIFRVMACQADTFFYYNGIKDRIFLPSHVKCPNGKGVFKTKVKFYFTKGHFRTKLQYVALLDSI